MNILTAPFFALFSRKFYAQAACAGVAKSFLYVVYLTFLVFFAALFAVQSRLIPQANDFVAWLQSEVPVLQWNAETGLSMKDKTVFELIHPEYGPLARFDMTIQTVNEAQMGENSVFVTAQKIYMRQPGRVGFRIFDVTQLGDANAQPFEIRPENIGGFYAQIKPWIVVFMGAMFWAMFLVWKLLAALFYSWVALLVNMTRREKLHYSHLWTLSCFAITPAAFIQALQFAIPPLMVVPFGMGASFVVTTAYLFFAIKLTEPPAPAEKQSNPSA